MIANLIGKYCVIYLKQCVNNIASVRGTIVGSKTLGNAIYVCYEVDTEGHEFFVPETNIAYIQVVPVTLIQKMNGEMKASVMSADEEIKQFMQQKMDQVEAQYKERNTSGSKSKNSSGIAAEEESNSEFVL